MPRSNDLTPKGFASRPFNEVNATKQRQSLLYRSPGDLHNLLGHALPLTIPFYPGVGVTKGTMEGFAVFASSAFNRVADRNGSVCSVKAHLRVLKGRGSIGVCIFFRLVEQTRLVHKLIGWSHAGEV